MQQSRAPGRRLTEETAMRAFEFDALRVHTPEPEPPHPEEPPEPPAPPIGDPPDEASPPRAEAPRGAVNRSGSAAFETL
jgi:hypothetical protein